MCFSTVDDNANGPLRMIIAIGGERGDPDDWKPKRALIWQFHSVDEVLVFHDGPFSFRRDAQWLTDVRDAVDLSLAPQEVFPGTQRRTTDFQRLLPRHDEREPSRFEYEDPIPGGWARHIEP